MVNEFQKITFHEIGFEWDVKSHVRDLPPIMQLLSQRENAPFPQKETLVRIIDIISTNNQIANVLTSPDMSPILKKENELKGDCKLGVIVCIDGRISLLHQFGERINSREVAASLLEYRVEKDEQKNDRLVLLETKSGRLIGALKSIAESPENRDMLEIVTAHTGQHHKCGKITKDIEKGTLTGEIDTVALEEADKRRQAIENTYNDLLESAGKKKLDQVAITAMIDTDTMGFILNFGTAHEMSTTTLLTNGLAQQIESAIGQTVGTQGSMKETFTQIDSFVTYSDKVATITEYLLNIPARESVFHEYIETHYGKLTESQKKALRFTIARTLSNQYVSGLAIDNSASPFSHHEEQYLSLSPNGKPLGGRDITQQSFASTPQDRQDALDQTKIKLSILDQSRKSSQPDILFITNPMNNALWKNHKGTSFEAVLDAGKKYLAYLLEDDKLRQRIQSGLLTIVPIITDEDTGEVLEITDFSPYFPHY